MQVITESMAELPGLTPNLNPENPPNKRKSNSDSKPAIEVVTGFGVGLRGPEAAKPSFSRSACEPFQEALQLGLSRGRNARAIRQDLVSDNSFSAGYQSVRRYIYRLRGAQTPQTRAVIFTAPGEEAQVDYGSGPMVRDPQSGKYRRTRLFVLTLGCSRKAIRLLTSRSSSHIWAELHESVIVCDIHPSAALRRITDAATLAVPDG